MTKFLNISKDTTLGNTTPSDNLVSSQKAIKTYIDTNYVDKEDERYTTVNVYHAETTISESVLNLSEDISINSGEYSSYGFYYNSDSEYIQNNNVSEGYGTVSWGKINFTVPAGANRDVEVVLQQTYEGYEGYQCGGEISTLDHELNEDSYSDGNNREWIGYDEGTTQHTVTYTNVAPGSHYFVVKCYNNDYDGYECKFEIKSIKLKSSTTNKLYDYDTEEEIEIATLNDMPEVIQEIKDSIPSPSSIMNTQSYYVPCRPTDASATRFDNSKMFSDSTGMTVTSKLHIGSTSPSSYWNKGRLTIYDNTPSQNVTSLALLNYGGGGGSGVSIDMYNTSANGGIPSGRFALIDNGNYSGYLQLLVKKSGSQSNPLLPALNIIPVPASNSLTTAVAFGKDEFHNVLFDLHKPEASCTITDTDKRWGGSGTSYSVTGSNKFNPRLLVAAGDIVSFNNFQTEAAVVTATSSTNSCAITTATSLGTVSNANISVKKAYMKITDENNNIKLLMNPYGKLGLGVSAPAYELDVAGTINASTDVKINGVSVALPTQTGNSGKFLTTNGTTSSWADIPEELPSQSGNSGKFLTTNGTAVSWADTPSELPSQSGQSGKVLTTNGTAVSWTSFPTVDQTYSGTSTNAQSGVAVKSAIDAAISSTYKAAGSVAFANLPTLGSTYEGYVYNVSDSFTTTSDFVEGAGKTYPAGTNVVCIDVGSSTYKWDVLAGFVDLSGYQTLIDSTHKLSADLVDDTSTTNKFVTASDKTTWSGKQDALVSGTNIKTINSTSLLGSGDIEIIGLPSQTSQSGKFLTTNGTSASWANAFSSMTYDSSTETLTFG